MEFQRFAGNGTRVYQLLVDFVAAFFELEQRRARVSVQEEREAFARFAVDVLKVLKVLKRRKGALAAAVYVLCASGCTIPATAVL